jgi:hypothetical protein
MTKKERFVFYAAYYFSSILARIFGIYPRTAKEWAALWLEIAAKEERTL